MRLWQKVKCKLKYHEWIPDFIQINFTIRDPDDLTGLDGLVTKREWTLIRSCKLCKREERLSRELGWVKL